MGVLRIAIIVLLLGLHAAAGIPGWLSSPGSPYLLRALTYSFFHASWWHLAVNCIAAWTVYSKAFSKKACKELALSFIIAVTVYPLSLRPVIGFSNILYATIGMRTPAFSSPWWRRTPVVVFLLVTVGMIFVPRFSATTHMAAFALGIAIAHLRRFWDSIRRDAGRYLQ